MNYKTINQAFLLNKKVTINEQDKEQVYNYLAQNDCALYFAEHLALNPSEFEEKLIKKAKRFNTKFIKTLSEIEEANLNSKTSYILFKTYKHFNDVYAGDIDILVSPEEIDDFLSEIQKLGYKIKTDGMDKWECTKEDRVKIEPRLAVSHHGIQISNYAKLKHYSEKSKLFEFSIHKTGKELDVVFLLLNSLYGPNFLRLQLFSTVLDCDWELIKKISKDLNVSNAIKDIYKDMFKSTKEKSKFPLFASNLTYIKFWKNNIWYSPKVDLGSKVKHFIFFFYMKYMYLFFGWLVFERDWYRK